MSYQHLNKVLIFKSALQLLIFIAIYLWFPQNTTSNPTFFYEMWSSFGAQTLTTVPEQGAVLLCDVSPILHSAPPSSAIHSPPNPILQPVLYSTFWTEFYSYCSSFQWPCLQHSLTAPEVGIRIVRWETMEHEQIRNGDNFQPYSLWLPVTIPCISSLLCTFLCTHKKNKNGLWVIGKLAQLERIKLNWYPIHAQ